jgi:hybrid cluster-associated redox disulfide protein
VKIMAKAEKITKEMGIMEIIQKKPAAAPVMMDYGLHCLGCAASQFESLEQGCLAHGIDEEKIKEMVEKINKLK